MKSFIIKLIQRSRRQPEQGQGIVEYIMILAFVALAVFLIINLMGPAISNTFSDFVERAPVAPPDLVGYTRVPPTATATNDPNPILTITYVGSCTGTVTPSSFPPYTGGEIVTLTAVPDAGCEFAGWGDDLSGTNNPESITLTSDKTVSANFIPIKYTLNVAVYGNGAVTASPNKTEYDPNEVVTLTAVPESGYSFLLWQGDGTTGANPLVRTLTMNSDKSVDAYFQVGCYTVTLTADPPSSGSVNPSLAANCIGDPGKYEHGTSVDFTAVAAPGYVFSNWSGDITGSTNPYTNLSIIGPRNITANFVEQDYTLTLNVNPAGGGTLVANPNLPTYHYGDQTQLTATANTGYTFSGWSGSASGSTNPYTLTFDENETVTANFTSDCYTLTLGKLPANGGNVSTNPNSSGGCPSGQYNYGTIVTLTANPANGYRFQTWSGDISGTNATAGITMFGNMNITANFQQCYALNITNTPSGGGAVSRNPAPGCTGGATYAPGTNVTLTAAANSGYTFDSWTGVDSSSGNTASVNMNATRNVTARYLDSNPVLFVVGNTTLNGADTAVYNRLVALGYGVTVMGAASSQTSDATGRQLIVISSTCNSGDVNTKFRSVAVPVILWEHALYDDMNMTGNGSADHGWVNGEYRTDVINSSHPLGAGYGNNTRVTNSNQGFTWGLPNSNGITIATIDGDSSKYTIFAYETGATMVNSFTAPARRVGFFLYDDTASDWRTEGINLFDAAVNWAVGNS